LVDVTGALPNNRMGTSYFNGNLVVGLVISGGVIFIGATIVVREGAENGRGGGRDGT
jgi:hypothetical protein